MIKQLNSPEEIRKRIRELEGLIKGQELILDHLARTDPIYKVVVNRIEENKLEYFERMGRKYK